MPNEKAPEPLSEEKLGSKKVCGVCGRERLNGLCRAKDSDRYCDTASADGYDTARCWRLGYERLAAILTPEVLRLIEAGRAYREAVADADRGVAGTETSVRARALIDRALALPFVKPAEPSDKRNG